VATLKRYLEAFFRHPVLLTLPVVLAVFVSVGYTLMQPRAYVSIGSLWTDSPVPESSSIDLAPSSTPPSALQAAVFSELLHTRAFNLRVGRHSSERAYLASHRGADVDDRLAKLGRSVTLDTPGPQLLRVVVSADSARDAATNGSAYLDAFVHEVTDTRRQRGESVVRYYAAQLAAKRAELTDAQAKLSEYQLAHGAAAPITDSDAARLVSGVNLAQEQYAEVRDRASQADLDLSHVGDTSVLRVVDTPRIPSAPEGRMRELAFALAGGLLAGLLVVLALLVFFVARGGVVYSAADLTPDLGLRVAGSMGKLTAQQVRDGAGRERTGA
jgi:uncharacterized protein involved in exopolysaccharide biosynthesis